MDSGEHGASTSSPSAKRCIASIREGAEGRPIRIELTDGSSFFASHEFMERSPLREGDEVDEALAEALAQETFTLAATEKAVQYLARREHSREELRRKLLRKEYPQAAVEGALDACERRGYLDDERFARLWTESRIRRRPDGPKKVEAALLSKGVSREIAERVVAELFTEEVIEETLRRAAQKGRRRAGDDPLRLKNYLLSRGFTAPLINKYIR